MDSTKPLTLEDIRSRIVATEQVAHVTFYIVKDEGIKDEKYEVEDYYSVYSESKKSGLRLVSQSFEYQQNDTGSYEDALVILRGEMQRLEEVLESKRAGFPTQKQVYFLFCEKIPIPVDLTWGQASDLIDERLVQKAKDKQQAQLERFKGLQVGMRAIYDGYEKREGTISKLATNNKGDTYAYIKFDGTNQESKKAE